MALRAAIKDLRVDRGKYSMFKGGSSCLTTTVSMFFSGTIPVVAMPVRELQWLLDKPFWKGGATRLAVSGQDAVDDPERYRAEYGRTMATDLSYPINVILLCGRWRILDGVHRLLKAWICGHDTILAKQAHERDIPLFRRRWSEPHHHHP